MKCQVTWVIVILFMVNSVLAQYDECGKREVKIRPRIIGGNLSRPGMWPWQVGIKIRKVSGNWDTDCGGALVAPQWVLTAAHCFFIRNESSGKLWFERSTKLLNEYKVVAGDHDINSYERTEQQRTPLEIHIHPSFRFYPYLENDIALIKLDRKVTLGPNVRTVCLPNEDLAKPEDFGTVAGWGVTRSGFQSSFLRHSSYKIQHNDVCNRTTSFGFNPTVMFCAGDGKGHSDTCSGDSGGSVVRRVLINGQHRWVTIGIVSWGEGCAVGGKYGYYTRLQPFVDWILLKTNSLCMATGPLRNGVTTPDKRIFQHNDTVTFHCNAGYTRIGNSVLSCQRNGSWDGYRPLCLASCSDPGVPRHGVRLDNDFKHGHTVRFRCKQGYELIGESFMTCNKGRWDHSRPKCAAACADVGHPINGLRKPDKKRYFPGETVIFECKKDHTRLGKSSLFCQSDGTWNASKPICLAPCQSPNVPQNGIILDNSFKHGQIARFRCQQGYKTIGASFVTCINGRWDSSPPTCSAPCSNPGIPFSGKRLDHSFLHGDKVRFSCKKRYTIEGEHTITCTDGRWDHDTPKCMAPCLDPGVPSNGRQLDKSFLHGDKVRFTCDAGWKVDGEHTITCTDGRWDHNAPKCLPEGCAAPRLPDKGGIHSKKNFYDHGEGSSFYCYHGYKLVGDQSASCRNGKWNNDPPSCKRKCRNPGSPSNGWKNGDDYFEGKQVTFTCSRDYDLIGLQAIRCLNTGRWSGPVPHCKKRCTVNRVQNSVFTVSKNVLRLDTVKHGTRITYTCTSGYTLEGDKRMTCSDGKWSSRTPQCKAPCSNPGSIQNGGKIGNTVSHGNTVMYYCTSGYTLDGPGSLRCNNGRWDTPVPTCKESCRNPGLPRNAIRRGDSFEHGKQVSFSCQSGTKLVGSPWLMCDDGKWSSEVPKCLEICNDPGRPQNGYRKAKRLPPLSGDKVTFYCKSWKYELVGSKEIFCDKGTWNGSVPQCLGLCKAPNNIGSVIAHLAELRGGGGGGGRGRGGAWYKHGRRIRFSCSFGKELDGANETICADSHWSKDFPECKVPCREPNAIINGTQHGTKFKFQFECDAGYTLKGRSTITCNQGVWSDSPPRCLRLCPRVYAPRNGVLLDNNFESGATVRFRCKDGYTLRGPHNITCQDRTWNYGRPPVCKADCTDPGTPKDGQRQGDVFSHGSVVNFTCNGGKMLIGSARIHCTNGSWSYRKPVCEAKCKDPESPPNAMSQLGFTKEGRQTVTYSCRSSMDLIGQRVLTCNQGAWSHDLPSCSDCGSSLGMQNKNIPNANIRASTYQDRDHRPRYGRLNNLRAWCSRREWKPYLEIDLAKPYWITHLATQGSERDNNWVTQYIVTHTLARTSFTAYRENDKEKLFRGNIDATSVVRHKIKKPFIARKIQFRPNHPTGFFFTHACMRVEIYGCDIPTDCVMVGSRVLGKWGSSYSGLDYYYKAYVKADMANYVELDLENGENNDQYFNTVLKRSIVLDVPPKQEELQIGTRVLAPWNERFYPGKIAHKRGKHYYVNFYNVKAWFVIDQLRLLKKERFCE